MSRKLYHLDGEYDPGGPQCPGGFLLLTVTSKNHIELSRTKTGKSQDDLFKTICNWVLSLPLSLLSSILQEKNREEEKEEGREAGKKENSS